MDDERWPPGKIDESWDWVVARNVDDAIWYVKNYGLPYHIAFDHDLGSRKISGMDFAVWFSEYILCGRYALDGFTFSVHSMNPVGGRNIQNRMEWLLENLEE